MKRTFNHSGAAGDLIYALPAIRALGGGKLYMYPTWGPWCDEPMVNSLRPLLLAQPYIDGVEFIKLHGQTNLDQWRHRYSNGLNLAEMVLRFLQLPYEETARAWLSVQEYRQVAPVIIHRSPRYHNSNFPWLKILEKYKGQIAMVGFKFEHQAFCQVFGYVPHYRTENYLELAEVIRGSTLFIGNQSSPYAVAEGMKHNTIQEVAPGIANCLFDRPNAGYGIDDTLFLPELP